MTNNSADEDRDETDSLFDGRAGALRDATESGPLFDEAYRPGQTDEATPSNGEAGLVAGSRDDPVLVAGVGYPLLGDLALGTVVAYRVLEWGLPGVAVADCSHTPVAAYQTITAGAYETVILVGSEKRGGELNDGTPSENPGVVREYDATEYEVPEDELVERVGESAMGSNTVENVLAIAEAFDGIPDDTRVITVEPGYDSWGMTVDEFTDPVERALEDVLERVLENVDDALEDA